MHLFIIFCRLKGRRKKLLISLQNTALTTSSYNFYRCNCLFSSFTVLFSLFAQIYHFIYNCIETMASTFWIELKKLKIKRFSSKWRQVNDKNRKIKKNKNSRIHPHWIIVWLWKKLRNTKSDYYLISVLEK